MTVKAVRHIVKESARRIGVSKSARRLHLNDASSLQLTRDAEIIPRLKTADYLGVVPPPSTVLRFVINPGHTT
jgi:hypothetical protein